MDKRHKDIMRVLVIRLRHILVGAPTEGDEFVPGNLDRELERIGIMPDGTITPIDALAHLHNGELRAYRVAATILTPLAREQRPRARREIIERAAYTWINRLLALRAMEVRHLIDSTLQGDEAYGDLSEKLYFLRQDEPERTSGADGGWWAVVEDACNAQVKALPGLFTLDDPAAALHPAPAALIQCIELVSGIQLVQSDVKAEDLDITFADPDVIGWAYQFYQEEAKASIDAKCKSGGKAASRSEIIAKTQLFTEPYMVQWLLQNSLGRSYHEAYPRSSLPATWAYYVQPKKLEAVASFGLAQLTLLDPCMGSGHFLRAAFDMFVAMYREQQPELSAKDIADTILNKHLYGIDLDPRAAQLTALTLYLRAWELIRDEQHKARKLASNIYIPPTMNLATTPTGLSKGALERHLQRVPEDKIFKSLLENIFTGLEQADILGSLLRPREYLDSAIEELIKPRNLELDFDWTTIERLREIQRLGRENPAQLRDRLLETIANSFHIEAGNTDDVSISLFGREAEQGIRLLQVLNRKYAVVVTNPPYMGSKHMDILLKKYTEKHYPLGKRDLYATFILRCLELCQSYGRSAIVTQQGWMFSSSYTGLRAVPAEKLIEEEKSNQFRGLLRETSVEALAHLGEFAFEDGAASGAFVTMFTLANRLPDEEHEIVAFRLIGLKNPMEKSQILRYAISFQSNTIKYAIKQKDLLTVVETPILYWFRPHFFSLLQNQRKLGDIVEVRQGLATTDNNRFLRCFWEVTSIGLVDNKRPVSGRWFWYAKGGRYQKWAGLEWLVVRWEQDGIAIKEVVVTLPGTTHWSRRVANQSYYFRPGLTYTQMARGALGLRMLNEAIFDVKGAALFLKSTKYELVEIAACLSSHTCSYLIRAISLSLDLHVGYLSRLPIPNDFTIFREIGQFVVELKHALISTNQTERRFTLMIGGDVERTLTTLLHTAEGVIEHRICVAYGLSDADVQVVSDDTGTPAGWYPLIVGYDTLPSLLTGLDLPKVPQELFDYLDTHKRITLSMRELARVKANLRALYEAGPKAKGVEQEEREEIGEEEKNKEAQALGAHIPMPTETFLEELSVKMELHPISIYWMLEELCAEGVGCKPEEKRLLEDRLSVLVLRLLGHRWPRQREAEEPVPAWAERYGIIPLVPGTGKLTLAERVRVRLYQEDGPLDAQRTEALLQELTGYDLEQWLCRSFFVNHVRQFKQRPIAWHFASTPTKGANSTGKGALNKKRPSSASRCPAFECLLYYHASSKGALARIRTQYVEPVLNAERNKIDQYSSTSNEASTGRALFPQEVQQNDDFEVTMAKERIRELEDFVLRLQRVEDAGFASPELEKLLIVETLDRWCNDGYEEPASYDDLRRDEEAWHVDINDGVRVNIAPLQLAGVLASDVLKPADAKKAIADRAHWRADERCWVREGKLPRCGWMDDNVQASKAWLEREARQVGKAHIEQLTLEQGECEV